MEADKQEESGKEMSEDEYESQDDTEDDMDEELFPGDVWKESLMQADEEDCDWDWRLADFPQKESANYLDLFTHEDKSFTAVEDIHVNASMEFCCGGTVNLLSKLKIVFKDNNTFWDVLEVPIESPEVVDKLASRVKTYEGRDGKYLKVEPSHFMTDFNPQDYDIFNNVKRFMWPEDEGSIKGCLRELIIQQQGDISGLNLNHDTLLVILPGSYSAIGVDARIGFNNIRYAVDSKKLTWIAIRNKSSYQVGTVSDGPMVMLVYHLQLGEEVARNIFLGLGLHEKFTHQLADENFFSQGALLGFPCKFWYPLDEDTDEVLKPRQTLKGADALIYYAAEAAGLKSEARVIKRKRAGETTEYCNMEGIEWVMWSTTVELQWPEVNGTHDDGDDETVYDHAVAIVVHIPPWKDRKKMPQMII